MVATNSGDQMNTRRQFLGGLALTGGLTVLSHKALANLPEIQTRTEPTTAQPVVDESCGYLTVGSAIDRSEWRGDAVKPRSIILPVQSVGKGLCP